MPPLHELRVVDHPEGAEVVFVADEALVQRQVGADRVLCGWARQGSVGVQGVGVLEYYRIRSGAHVCVVL